MTTGYPSPGALAEAEPIARHLADAVASLDRAMLADPTGTLGDALAYERARLVETRRRITAGEL